MARCLVRPSGSGQRRVSARLSRHVRPRTRLARTGAADAAGPGSAGGTVLVVEDDLGLRELLSEGLGLVGYAVETAPNGAAALERIRRHAPGLILLDLRMPVMDGWEFARRYQATPGPRAPIIVVTGTPDAAEQAAVLHAAAVLDKPFHLDELRALVASFARP